MRLDAVNRAHDSGRNVPLGVHPKLMVYIVTIINEI